MKQEIVVGFCRHWKNKKTFYGPDTENLDLLMTVSIWSVSLLTVNTCYNDIWLSHVKRNQTNFWKLAGFLTCQGSIYWGAGGKFLQTSQPPPKKKSFSWKKIKSHFKYWSYLTTISRHQWLMSRNAISANPEHYLSQNFLGEHAPEPPKKA